MQMLPYLALPMLLGPYTIEGKEHAAKTVLYKFWPTCINGYYEDFFGNGTVIYPSNKPDGILLNVTVDEYEKQIKGYYTEINKPIQPAKIKTLN